MKRTLVITLALISSVVAQAQLPTIKPTSTVKVPNISHATYMSEEYDDEDDELYWDLHCSPYTTPGTQTVVASSELNSQGSASYLASNIVDSNHETGWVEGVSGYGVGQWVELRDIYPDGEITALHILNGYVKSDKVWSENARVKRLKVYCDDKPICILELQNSRSMQVFNVQDVLGGKRYIGKLRFEIMEVYPGTKYQDTVISEIYFTAVP